MDTTKTVNIERTSHLISQLAYLCEQEIEEVPHLVSDLMVLRQENVDTMTPKISLESDLDPSFQYELIIPLNKRKAEIIQWFNDERNDKPLYFSEADKEKPISFSGGKATLKEKQRNQFCQQITGLERYDKVVTPLQMVKKFFSTQSNQAPENRPTFAQLNLLNITPYREILCLERDNLELAVNYRGGEQGGDRGEEITQKKTPLSHPLLAVTHYDEERVLIKGLNDDFRFNTDKLTVREDNKENKNVRQIEKDGQVMANEIEIRFQQSPVKKSHTIQMTWSGSQEELMINLFINNR